MSKQHYLKAKRAIDVSASFLLIVVTAPIICIACIAIVVTSKGPILYRGKRWGLNETQFTCWKLRTMHVDQDAILTAHGLASTGNGDRLLVFKFDPRITPVGNLLRKLSVDELPQLFNVLRGDMSLIGPRPLAISMLENFPQIRAARSVVKPGITGLWQVRHRMKNVSVHDMIDDDLEYIARCSLYTDLKIAVLTVPRLIEPAA